MHTWPLNDRYAITGWMPRTENLHADTALFAIKTGRLGPDMLLLVSVGLWNTMLRICLYMFSGSNGRILFTTASWQSGYRCGLMGIVVEENGR